LERQLLSQEYYFWSALQVNNVHCNHFLIIETKQLNWADEMLQSLKEEQ
jgi:hypothetical protein